MSCSFRKALVDCIQSISTRLRQNSGAIQSYEMNWRANPYIMARSFFDPTFDLEAISHLEREVVRNLFFHVNSFYRISSKDSHHFKLVEGLPEISSKSCGHGRCMNKDWPVLLSLGLAGIIDRRYRVRGVYLLVDFHFYSINHVCQ